MPQSKQSPTKRMVFWPHPHQEEVITAALNLVMETVPTKFKTVALEYICQSYLGGGLAFSDWKQALTYARKHAHDPSTFAQQVLALIEELCPNLAIEATISVKGVTTNQRGCDMERNTTSTHDEKGADKDEI